jgi:hypothetical protein
MKNLYVTTLIYQYFTMVYTNILYLYILEYKYIFDYNVYAFTYNSVYISIYYNNVYNKL